MDFDFLHTEMLYIIEDCLFYVLTFANSRKVTLLCLQAMLSAYHGTFNACLQNLM